MSLFLGCIADDYTGASDIASQLAEQGVRTVQLFGIPNVSTQIDPAAEAIIIGLKTRTVSVDSAISQSLEALSFLQKAGCQRFYFKYCSTFDSTSKGNIGPVSDALAEATRSTQVIFCPAFPKNGRTVYRGHLFVHDTLLSESSLSTHPLTPMTDSNLVRWLGKQTDCSVGLLSVEALDATEKNMQESFDNLVAENRKRIVVDALNQRHLDRLGKIFAHHVFVTGGSALAPALVSAWREEGLMSRAATEVISAPKSDKNAVILSGSCSEQANLQLKAWKNQGGATYFLDPERLMKDDAAVSDALQWIRKHIKNEPVLVYATSPSENVTALHGLFNRNDLGDRIEQAFVEIAQEVTLTDTQTLIVAGGETSGAVVAGLCLEALTVGPSIAPGVPWMFQHGERPLSIALKSGNFGSENFYHEAMVCLKQEVVCE